MDLQNLKRLLRINRIEPVWRGRAPELVRPSSSQAKSEESLKRKRASRRNASRRRSRRTAPTPT